MDGNQYEPAFRGEVGADSRGLSKMEYFFAAVLQGILANPAYDNLKDYEKTGAAWDIVQDVFKNYI